MCECFEVCAVKRLTLMNDLSHPSIMWHTFSNSPCAFPSSAFFFAHIVFRHINVCTQFTVFVLLMYTQITWLLRLHLVYSLNLSWTLMTIKTKKLHELCLSLKPLCEIISHQAIFKDKDTFASIFPGSS